MFLSFDSGFFDYVLLRTRLSLKTSFEFMIISYAPFWSKRQKGKMSENPKIEIDTALYITEIIILFHATFQLGRLSMHIAHWCTLK